MRCLTLANALKSAGKHCHFICRKQPGDFSSKLIADGHSVYLLNTQSLNTHITTRAHAQTSGLTIDLLDQTTDAEHTAAILEKLRPGWLIVDHYELDKTWETSIGNHHKKLLVIDDLADRSHKADILIDQNLGRRSCDYIDLVPESTRLFIGPKYALLRPEFAAMREASLQRRQRPALRKLIISMGGYDQPDATSCVLNAIRRCQLHPDTQIEIILSDDAPWLDRVKEVAKAMPWDTDLLTSPQNMAQLLTTADLVIGAVGSSSWERCCLGLPTLLITIAKNQQGSAQALSNAGAGILIGTMNEIQTQLPRQLERLSAPKLLAKMSEKASDICDGTATRALVEILK